MPINLFFPKLTHSTHIPQIITSGSTQIPFSIAKLSLSSSSSNPLKQTTETEIPIQSNMFLCNTMIRTHSQSDSPQQAVFVYKQMLQKEMAPNSHTYPFLLNAVTRFARIAEGKSFHTQIIKFGLDTNLYVVNSLITMYARLSGGNDGLGSARELFDEMPERDLVSWNAMIGGYVWKKQFHEAFSLFRTMEEENLAGNEVTVVSLLSACAQSGDLEEGKRIHCYIGEKNINCNEIVCNSLIDMYAKCGRVEESRRVFDAIAGKKKNLVAWNSMISGYCRCGYVDTARQLFHQMPGRNIVSWTTMIAGYVQNNRSSEALLLFRSLESEMLKLDEVLMVSLLSACADLGALDQGRSIHVHLKNCFSLNSILGSALIDMYAKCGKIEKAILIFRRVEEKDVNPWTALITGLALHGRGRTCLEIFSSMEQAQIRPNEITFVGVLCGCSHSGLVEEGLHHFRRMSEIYKISPMIEHYGCMVDLLGRAGLLKEAEDFIVNMPIVPNAGVWGALLGACRNHGNVEIGEIAAKVLIDLEPRHGGRYVLLSNMYAAANKWEEVNKVRDLMKDRGVEKERGWSWIEVDGVVCQFSVGDLSHLRNVEISFMLEAINREIKMNGNVS